MTDNHFITLKKGVIELLQSYRFGSMELETIWTAFYRGNRHLFPYQSYEYNQVAYRCFRFQTSRLNEKYFFYVYYQDKTPKLIMPLILKQNKLYIFGDFESAGALDFIYPEDVCPGDFAEGLTELRKIHTEELCINKLNIRSKLYDYLLLQGQEKPANIRQTGRRICVKIPFNDYDSYYNRLTKNNRQNLRTAYNRLEKDGLSWNLAVDRKIRLHSKSYQDEFAIYLKRESERDNKSRGFFSKLRLKYTDPVTVALRNMKNGYDFKFYIGNKLAAFMMGLESENKEVIIPKLAIDSNFSKYSPGKLMINETVKYLTANSNIRTLDLSKGSEKYKYDMGGTEHINYDFAVLCSSERKGRVRCCP